MTRNSTSQHQILPTTTNRNIIYNPTPFSCFPCLQYSFNLNRIPRCWFMFYDNTNRLIRWYLYSSSIAIVRGRPLSNNVNMLIIRYKHLLIWLYYAMFARSLWINLRRGEENSDDNSQFWGMSEWMRFQFEIKDS